MWWMAWEGGVGSGGGGAAAVRVARVQTDRIWNDLHVMYAQVFQVFHCYMTTRFSSDIEFPGEWFFTSSVPLPNRTRVYENHCAGETTFLLIIESSMIGPHPSIFDSVCIREKRTMTSCFVVC